MLSLVELLDRSCKTFAKSTAIAFDGRTINFADFGKITDRVAAGLMSQGITAGDRVGLYCVNSDFFAQAYFGILKVGATVVPINLLLNPKEVAYILNDAGARALIYFEAFTPAVQSLKAAVPKVETYICIGAQNPIGGLTWFDLISYDPLSAYRPPADLAAILYTSGTTGFPKGAMLTHDNLASNVESIRRALHLEPGKDVLLVVLPMFHAFAATVGMIFPLLNGCTLVTIPKFDPVLVAETVAKHGVTVLPMVPSMYNVMMKLPDALLPKFDSIRFFVSGAAALPVELMNQFEARFGKLIYEGDGPTECSPVTSVNPIGGVRKPASIGVPIPSVQMKIMDESGNEMKHGEIGEICVRGPNVMKGYWNLPKETAESFFGEWFRTGDLGTEDDDGYFFIVDRKKDMIIVNGMNVYPRIIEELLYKHPAVREAAVIGEPDELHGEIPVAVIALKEGQQATAAELRAFCREHLGRHEIPRKVLFVKELPRNAAGKVLKRELRKHGELERGIDSRV